MELDNKKRLADKWLDSALKHYDTEPEAGLEDRLLRKLRAVPRQRAPWQFWSAWATVAALALAIAVVFVHYQHSGLNNLNVDDVSRRIAVRAQPAPPPIIVSTKKPEKKIHRPSRAVAQRQWPSQFPTPQPMSEQERMFVSYAEHFPTEAMLTQQEHEQFEEVVKHAQEANENAASASNQER